MIQNDNLKPRITDRGELAVPLIWPNVVLVTLVLGLLKFGWFSALNRSARSSPPNRSLNLNLLTIEVSRLSQLGPLSPEPLRFRLPNGAYKTPFGPVRVAAGVE